MTREEADFIGGMNMCDEISNEAYKKIMCHCEEQEPCEMTAEEYRQRMIQAFYSADCDELIAICALPTEKEFKHLEWLLKNHYKKEPCEDAISREVVQKWYCQNCCGRGKHNCSYYPCNEIKDILNLPPVTPQQKVGKWTRELVRNEYGGCIEAKMICSECGQDNGYDKRMKFCPNCGCRMKGEDK